MFFNANFHFFIDRANENTTYVLELERDKLFTGFHRCRRQRRWIQLSLLSTHTKRPFISNLRGTIHEFIFRIPELLFRFPGYAEKTM